MQTNFETINLCELSDADIVARMRHCNYDKYKTLVRMHLSFELDLNTDEFDLPCHEIAYEDKGKLKKWNKLSKKHKGTICAATAKSAGNSPSEGLGQQIDAGFMFHLEELKEFLMLEKNVKQEGIFRKTGSVSRQNELRLKVQNENPLNLEASGFSAHDCATVFKSFLAELTEPLLTDAHYPAHLQLAPLCIGRSFSSGVSTLTRPPNPERIKREQRLLHSMQLLILLLPDENRKLLEHIIDILHDVANMEHINKMSAENLATIFTPHLICPRNLPPEALHYLAKKLCSIIAYMITKGGEIFHVPAKLSTDIRAYFIERKRKKTMSPEQTLDESISDISTVNTVYTFVDRERTAKCNTKNTTDTELAQLYAHIQSLPESSKKRRLIKQFNKQNGQGTPLQLVIMNRIKNSEATRSAKSFGDSIKKHIFHKSIISRTPKRTSTTTTTVGVETPNCSNAKQPKLRVLFQSPPTSCLCTGSAAATPEKLSAKTSNSSVTNTPYADPLQKSISSSSLILSSKQRNPHIHSQHNFNTNKHNNDEIGTILSCSSVTNSNDGLSQQQLTDIGYSISAPVSRQTSHDFHTTDMIVSKPSITLNTSNSSSLSSSTSSSTLSSQNFQASQSNCCITPLKLISEAAKQLVAGGGIGVVDKKSVAWHDYSPFEDDESLEPSSILLSPTSVNELKSRYKSEPNLSRIIKDNMLDIPETLPEQQQKEQKHHETACKMTLNSSGKSLTRKLIKGVSMGNLKFPFTTPDSTKRLADSVSSSFKRRHSDDASTTTTNEMPIANTAQIIKRSLLPHDDQNSFDDLDDDTFEDDPNDHLDSDSDIDVTDNERLRSAVNVQTVINSSSSSDMPIAYYRMPKSMQESIMTPRSRKPVMILTTSLGSSDPNQTIYQTDLSSFREEDEDSSVSSNSKNFYNEDAGSVNYTNSLNEETNQAVDESPQNNVTGAQRNLESCKTGVLSENFKEYLRSRSVLTDSSFSSHPDDFGDDNDTDIDNESTHEIVDLSESQLSPSLLYCLDGNEPIELDVTEDGESHSMISKDSNETFFLPPAHITAHGYTKSCVIDSPFASLNNARKRAATNDIIKLTISPTKLKSTENNEVDCMASTSSSNKENITSKKILISDFPNETSF